MKIIAKTETFTEFLARGGKVTKCPPRHAGKKYRRTEKPKEELTQADIAALPAALKISFGLK